MMSSPFAYVAVDNLPIYAQYINHWLTARASKWSREVIWYCSRITAKSDGGRAMDQYEYKVNGKRSSPRSARPTRRCSCEAAFAGKAIVRIPDKTGTY